MGMGLEGIPQMMGKKCESEKYYETKLCNHHVLNSFLSDHALNVGE